MSNTTVKPLDLTKSLGKAKNRVARVGVELEGAWTKLPPGVERLEHDGSVFANGKPNQGLWPWVGELPIGPVQTKDLPDLMRRTYPQKVNRTCGMHIHVSFQTLWYYQLLMVQEYQETVAHYLTEWAKASKFRSDHHIWERLRGASEFCQKGFWPDSQAITKNKDYNRHRAGHRYTMIHYCGRLNTIECRVLPMMQSVEKAIAAAEEFISITNACILELGKRHNKKDAVINGTVALPDGGVYEEYIEKL